jgi:PilZ domain-containing protein
MSMFKKFASDITRGLRSMVRGIDADWQFEERRRTLRFKSRHKVDMHHGEGEKHVAYVMDYSMGGVRINSAQSLKVGEVVDLQFPHPLPGVSKSSVKCEVLWRRKNPKTLEMLYGAKFLETAEHMMQSWVSYFFRERGAASGDLVEDRKHVRCACSLDVLARSVENAQGKVLNIGLGGALLAINRPAEPGDQWGLDISGLSSFEGFHVKAIVQSCETGMSGLFNQRVEFKPPAEEQEKIMKKYILALSKDFWSS